MKHYRWLILKLVQKKFHFLTWCFELEIHYLKQGSNEVAIKWSKDFSFLLQILINYHMSTLQLAETLLSTILWMYHNCFDLKSPFCRFSCAPLSPFFKTFNRASFLKDHLIQSPSMPLIPYKVNQTSIWIGVTQ